MKNFKRNAKGITLVALVVTIVVLIILVVISINAALGPDGIIKKTEETSELHKDVEENDRVKLAVYGAFTEGKGTLLTNNVKESLENEFGADKVVTKGSDATFTGKGPWTFKGERDTYTIETTG